MEDGCIVVIRGHADLLITCMLVYLWRNTAVHPIYLDFTLKIEMLGVVAVDQYSLLSGGCQYISCKKRCDDVIL